MDPFRTVRGQWLTKIKLASEHKRKVFQVDADEGMKFFNGPFQLISGSRQQARADLSSFFPVGGTDVIPSVQMQVNKAAECVQLFGPVLYHRNPHRTVNPRKPLLMPSELFGNPEDPMTQQIYQQYTAQESQKSSVDVARSRLLEHYLNWTPTALDLKREMRMAIDECIIKGAGVLWHEIYTPPAGGKLIGSFQDSIDHLQIDPDCERLDEATFIARRCCHPTWKVEREYGLPPGTIRGNKESSSRQAEVTNLSDGEYRRKTGKTNDLCVYWKIWSKMGIGGYLSGMDKTVREWDIFGDHVYLVVCEGCDYPLNVPPEITDTEEIKARLQWEAPHWADGAWPMKILAFHEVPKCVWPMSHLKPAMGELRFINWAYSFIATKMKQAIKDKVATWKGMAEEMKKAFQSDQDYAFIEFTKEMGPIRDMIEYIQHPPFQKDFWAVLQAVEDNFARRTGLSELMYGMSAVQLRSAQEASLKGDQLRIRPDDMANKVEDFATDVARGEALLARWALDGADLEPIIGQTGAQFWDQLVAPSDPNVILRQLEYRIEAGSIRKPNRDKEIADANAAMQTLFQPTLQYSMQSGDFNPTNAIIGMWAKGQDLEPGQFQFQPPPPPEGPSPEEQQAQMEMQIAQMQAQMEQQKAEMEMQMEQQRAVMEMQMEQFRLQMDAQAHGQEMRQDQTMFRQELDHLKKKSALELKIQREKAAAQAAAAKKVAAAKPKSNGSSK